MTPAGWQSGLVVVAALVVGSVATVGAPAAFTDVGADGVRLSGAGDESDPFEPNDDYATATNITPGSYSATVSGTDEDVYRIELDAGDVLDATVTLAENVSTRPAFELRDADGDVLRSGVAGTAPAGSALTRRLAAQVGTNCTYYLVVRGTTGATAPYRLQVRTNANDRFEPNGAFRDATPVEDGTYRDLRIAWDERDVFRIRLDAGDTLDASISYDDDTSNEPDVGLFDGDGKLTAFSTRASPPARGTERRRVATQVDSTGVYYLVVDRSDAAVTTTYDLRVRTNANDPLEPNGVLAAAAPVTNESRDDLRIMGTERDVFELPLDAGEPFNASITYSGDAANEPRVEVQNASGETIGVGETVQGSAGDTETRRVTVRPNATGTYYLVVEGGVVATTTTRYELAFASGVPDPAPAAFRIGSFAPETEAVAGEPVDVRAEVANAGGAPGEAAIGYELRDTSGETVRTRTIRRSLAPGERTALAFTIDTAGVDTGRYTQVLRTAEGESTGELTLDPPDGGARTLDLRIAGTGRIEAPPNRQVTVPIVVASAPDGLASVEGINVSVRNASVARMAATPIDVGSSEFPSDRIAVNGSGATYVNFSASAPTNASSPEGDDVVVGVVRLNTTGTPGTTRVGLSARRGHTRSVRSPDPTVRRNARVAFETNDSSLVVSASPFPNRTTPPTDARPTAPGLEDFNGDGAFNFLDVVEVLFAIDGIPGDDAATVEAVDYDDDGTLGFLDVVELLFRL